jgi:prephenate dehydrogenase
MTLKKLAIVGVGLIGGSVALAARQRGFAARVVGADHDRVALDQALAGGLVDEACLDPAEAVASAEVVVFCAPVDRIAALVLAAAPHCAPGALLTDTGSTKGAIVAEVESGLPAGLLFAGSHPLAGSEKKGPLHARADLFADRLVIVTRTSRTPAEAVERATALWAALGARVRVMSPEEHDRSLALTSHLPQLAASALAGVLPAELFGLAATGFRDTTRLAGSNADMWVPIFAQNRAAVLAALERFEEQLACFRRALEADDRAAVARLMGEGKRARDALST